MKETALTDGERLQTVLDLLHISANKLSTIINVTPASLYHITAGRNSLSQDLIEKIIAQFPSASYSYLRAGRGEPFLTTEQEKRAQKALLMNPGEKRIDVDSIIENREQEKEDSIISHQISELIYQQRKSNELLESLVRENKEIKELLAHRV